EDAWRVEDVVPGAPAYARRLDAPLVGRAEELERLRAAYVDARDSGHCRVVTVVGEAGIGKARLMRELLLPLREGARVFVGGSAGARRLRRPWRVAGGATRLGWADLDGVRPRTRPACAGGGGEARPWPGRAAGRSEDRAAHRRTGWRQSALRRAAPRSRDRS